MGAVTLPGAFTCQDGKADEMAAVLAEMVGAAGLESGVTQMLTSVVLGRLQSLRDRINGDEA